LHQLAAPAAAAKQLLLLHPLQSICSAGEVFTEEIKIRKCAKIIAKRLAESLFTAPHYNLTIEVTMDDAMKSEL
jgi:pyruvate dehydrogenase E2 component (dihydrolipoamide acetyltransferase)